MQGLEKLSTLCGHTREELLAKYDVCLETGTVTNRKTEKVVKTQVSDLSNYECCTNKQSYLHCRVPLWDKARKRNTSARVSQICWFAAHGWVPKYVGAETAYVIDHIDGNPRNNTISNLQCIPQSENLKKKKRKHKSVPLQEAA